MKGVASRIPRACWEYGGLMAILCLYAAVTLLPPDTSLEQAERRGVLSACVPPLPEPGSGTTLERELLAAIAEKMNLRLTLYEVPAMTSNFDLRNWGINRAQCLVLSAGITDTPLTRAFIDVSPPYAENGVVAIVKAGTGGIAGLTVAVPSNLQSVDRLTLSRHLRRERARVQLVRNSEEAMALLQSGAVDAAVVPAQEATVPAGDWSAIELPPPLSSGPIVFGLWKGDLTLKRAFSDALEALKADGTVDAIRKRIPSAGV